MSFCWRQYLFHIAKRKMIYLAQTEGMTFDNRDKNILSEFFRMNENER
jgi:hypothetical protein